MKDIYHVTTPLTDCGVGKPIAAQCEKQHLAISGSLDRYSRFTHTFDPELVAWRVEVTVSRTGGDGEYPETLVGLCARFKGNPLSVLAFLDLMPGMNEQSHLTVLLDTLQTALSEQLVMA